MATKKKTPPAKATPNAHDKRVYFKQADFPLVSLQQAQRIASALVENFGGREGSPPDIALSMSNQSYEQRVASSRRKRGGIRHLPREVLMQMQSALPN